MRSFRLATDGVGAPRLESLPLPFLHIGPTATEADQARTPDPALATHVRSVRPLSRHDGEVTHSGDAAGRRLVFVVAGSLSVAVGTDLARLGPGDVLFLDHGAGGDHKLTWGGDARAFEVEVEDAWTPTGSVAPALEDPRAESEAARTDRIHVADELAHFAELDAFAPGDAQAVEHLSFLAFSPGIDADWHTEAAPTLVIVLTGGFELEVGGTGGARTFRPGDVCLTEDLHGQGHRTRTHGDTRVAAVGLPVGHRWS